MYRCITYTAHARAQQKKAIATKKKLKVRVPSKFLKRAVKKQVVPKKKKSTTKIQVKKKRKIKTKDSNNDTRKVDSSALAKLKRFVRKKRRVKVHPIVADKDE